MFARHSPVHHTIVLSSCPTLCFLSGQYIEANYPKVAFKPHLLRGALKTGVTTGKLVMVKASYKLSEAEKKPPKKV